MHTEDDKTRVCYIKKQKTNTKLFLVSAKNFGLLNCNNPEPDPAMTCIRTRIDRRNIQLAKLFGNENPSAETCE